MRGGEESWFAGKRRALRFVVLFGVGVVAFNLLYLLWVIRGEFFHSYLQLNAEVSAAVLTFFGDDASVSDVSIITPRFSLSIRRGCEAIQVSAFFVIAVLASPIHVSWWRRAIGITVGTLLLLTLNVVRIVSLYYTGIYFPSAFEVMHVDVWQPAFIVLALFMWVSWVWWESRTVAVEPHAVA